MCTWWRQQKDAVFITATNAGYSNETKLRSDADRFEENRERECWRQYVRYAMKTCVFALADASIALYKRLAHTIDGVTAEL